MPVSTLADLTQLFVLLFSSNVAPNYLKDSEWRNKATISGEHSVTYRVATEYTALSIEPDYEIIFSPHNLYL